MSSNRVLFQFLDLTISQLFVRFWVYIENVLKLNLDHFQIHYVYQIFSALNPQSPIHHLQLIATHLPG